MKIKLAIKSDADDCFRSNANFQEYISDTDDDTDGNKVLTEKAFAEIHDYVTFLLFLNNQMSLQWCIML